MPIRPGDTAPYAPPAAVLEVIRGFRDRGLAVPVTADVLIRAGVSESLVPRTLSALEGLELINDKGMPTPQLEGLRRATSDEFRPLLAEIVRAVYAEVFRFADPAKDDVERVADAFRAFNPIGQRRRMVTLFVGLCQACGLMPTPVRTTGVTSTPSRPRPQLGTRKGAVQAQGRPATAKRNARTDDDGILPEPLLGLIRAIPTDGWTQKKRDQFIKTFGSVLDFCYPITDAAASITAAQDPDNPDGEDQSQ